MPKPNPAALEFLKTRRSRPAKTLVPPGPGRATLMEILTVAARTPDHGKLEPWRMIVLERAALQRLAAAVSTRGAELELDPEQIEKMRRQFLYTDIAVAVVESPKPSEKIPAIEQTYSAGAVCYGLLQAALAAGWGANWLSGWATHDSRFVRQNMGLAQHERIAGIVHIGTETVTPSDRDRPALERIVTWSDT